MFAAAGQSDSWFDAIPVWRQSESCTTEDSMQAKKQRLLRTVAQRIRRCQWVATRALYYSQSRLILRRPGLGVRSL